MTISAQKELFALCGRLWRKIHTRLYKVRLPAVQWEDIEAVATARVFQKLDHFDETRGKIHNFAFTVMWRSVQNSLRAIIPNPKVNRDHKWRTNLLLARSLAVKVVETGPWGEEQVVVLPDIIDDTPQRDRLEIDEFRGLLNRQERQVFDLALSGSTLRHVARSLGYVDAGGIRSMMISLGRRWQSYRAGVDLAAVDHFQRRPKPRNRKRVLPSVPSRHDFLIAA